MLKMKDLNSQSKAELQQQFEQLSAEIFNLRCELSISRKLEKPHELKDKKKDRARILTALNQKH